AGAGMGLPPERAERDAHLVADRVFQSHGSDADLYGLADAEDHPRHALAAGDDAVLRPGILDLDGVAVTNDARMPPRDAGPRQDQVVLRCRAEPGLGVGQLELADVVRVAGHEAAHYFASFASFSSRARRAA